MNQSKILITVLLALLILCGGFYVWKMKTMKQEERATQTTEQPKQSVKTDEIESIKDLIDGEYTFAPINTSDWQVYWNEEAGFEIRFPELIKHVVNEQAFVDNSGKGISFYVTPYDRLRKKQMNDIDKSGFIDETFNPYIETGNIKVIIREAKMNDTQIDVVKYLFKEEPKNHNIEIWNEGYSVEEAFFQCKENICAIRTIFDQFSQEKEVLFYTVLSTLRLAK